MTCQDKLLAKEEMESVPQQLTNLPDPGGSTYLQFCCVRGSGRQVLGAQSTFIGYTNVTVSQGLFVAKFQSSCFRD